MKCPTESVFQLIVCSALIVCAGSCVGIDGTSRSSHHEPSHAWDPVVSKEDVNRVMGYGILARLPGQ